MFAKEKLQLKVSENFNIKKKKNSTSKSVLKVYNFFNLSE